MSGEKRAWSHEKDLTLSQVYSANEAFITGTLGGITPVARIDGRNIGSGRPGPTTQRIADLYGAYVDQLCRPG